MTTKTEKVDPLILEALLYGMAKGLDYLGIQGQLLLNKIGEEFVNYLTKKKVIQGTEHPVIVIGQLKDFFESHGIVDEIEVEIEGENITMKGDNWRLFDLFRSLTREDPNTLISCPMIIATAAILKKADYALQITGLEFVESEKRVVIGKGKLTDLKKERFTEEMAEEMLERMK